MSRSLRRTLAAGLLLGAALGLGCGEPFNNNPQGLRGPGAEVSQAFPGEVVQLYAEVTDADGDPLTYHWTQMPASPAGTFSDASAASPTWTAPSVTEPTSFALRLDVSDDHGNAIFGTTTVMVRPRTDP